MWEPLEVHAPHYSFAKRDNTEVSTYSEGFSVRDFMPVSSIGMVTARDALSTDFSREELWRRIQDFAELPEEVARQKFNLRKDVRDWKVSSAQADVRGNLGVDRIVPVSYRPFDSRWVYYTGNSRGIMASPCANVMRHMLGRNFGLVCTRTIEGQREFADAFVVSDPITLHSLSIKETNSLFPLYLYQSGGQEGQECAVNFNRDMFAKMKELAKDDVRGEPNEVNVFDYIYGFLHSSSYRSAYAEFLKLDFPRVPWPTSSAQFWEVSEKGELLRRLHLMDSSAVGPTPYPYIGDGNDVVTTAQAEGGRIFINDAQYFDNVPLGSWDFWIGGYQPAQKWLKDRKGRTLSLEDVVHYQRILKVLSRTQEIVAAL
jgi:predicted helicase